MTCWALWAGIVAKKHVSHSRIRSIWAIHREFWQTPSITLIILGCSRIIKSCKLYSASSASSCDWNYSFYWRLPRIWKQCCGLSSISCSHRLRKIFASFSLQRSSAMLVMIPAAKSLRESLELFYSISYLRSDLNHVCLLTKLIKLSLYSKFSSSFNSVCSALIIMSY